MAVRVAPRRLDWGGERGAVRVGVVWCGVWWEGWGNESGERGTGRGHVARNGGVF